MGHGLDAGGRPYAVRMPIGGDMCDATKAADTRRYRYNRPPRVKFEARQTFEFENGQSIRKLIGGKSVKNFQYVVVAWKVF